MSIDQIVAMISSVGFPIIACVGLYHMVTKTLKSLQDVVQANTDAIQRMIDTLKNAKKG